jgi:hypothetical protein
VQYAEIREQLSLLALQYERLAKSLDEVAESLRSVT